MKVIKEKIRSIVSKHYALKKTIELNELSITELKSFLYDRRNASFGDSLVNLIFSTSKSITKFEMTGLKVSDTILLNGFNDSTITDWLGLKGDKKQKANAIEALIFYMWLVHDYSIEEMALNLSLNLDKDSYSSHTDEIRFMSKSFSFLFDSFNTLLQTNE